MPMARREVMGAGLAAGAAGWALTAGSGQAQAAAPQQDPVAPAFYRFKVGEVEVTLVSDGATTRPLADGFVRNAALSDVQAALAAAFQPTGTLSIPFTVPVLNTGAELVVIDTGNGELGAPGSGRFLANLAAAGYAPEQVNRVILSHFHGDHINGLRNKAGEAVFANAEIMVPEPEWAFWMDESRMSGAPEAMQQAFSNVRRVFEPVADDVARYSGERELLPGLTTVPAPGHTPGHSVFVLASGNDSLLLWADTTNKPELFVRNPGWHAVFDMDAAAAEANRRRLLDMAASERMRVAGYHFPFPANGYIARDEGSYAFVPAFWHG